MKIQALFLTVLVLALSQTSQNQHWNGWDDHVEKLQKSGWEVAKNAFGVVKAILEKEDGVEHLMLEGFDVVQSVLGSPSGYEKWMERMLSYTHEEVEETILTCSKGNKADFWKWASIPVGIVGKGIKNGGIQSVTLESHPDDCFQTTDVIYNMTGPNSYTITFNPMNKKVDHCSDVYTLATAAGIHEPINLEGKFTFTVEKAADNKMKAINLWGLHIYRSCDQYANILPDLFMTVALFAAPVLHMPISLYILCGFGTDPNIPIFGSKPTWWMEQLNPEFIKKGSGFEWRKREDKFVDLDETEVKSGDFLCITRMDGLDQIIQWGAGSICGHSVVLLEFDGEMYAIESQDAWYWPKHDIQRNPWKQWKKYAQNAGFNVALLPMREDIRAKLDIDKAAEFFRSVEGMPYGYHNFIFGWLDVPKYNVPPVTTLDFLYVAFSMLQRIYDYPVTRIMGEAVNKRLNTTGLNLEQLANIMELRGLTIDEVFGMVEQDDWVYSDGKSMVCSSFVIAIYKAGGLFGDLSIQATEFTPRDIYQLNFWDNGYKAEKCKGVDDDLPYCQIMGKHKMDVFKDGYNTIDPYDHMFEKCPSMPPKYERPGDC